MDDEDGEWNMDGDDDGDEGEGVVADDGVPPKWLLTGE